MLRDKASLGFKTVPGVVLRPSNATMFTAKNQAPVAMNSNVEEVQKVSNQLPFNGQQMTQGATICAPDMNVDPLFNQGAASLPSSQKIVDHMIGQSSTQAKEPSKILAQPRMRWNEANASSKFAPSPPFGQQTTFGMGLRPTPISLGSRSGIMNLKMQHKTVNDSTKAGSEFSIQTAAADKGSKQVFVQDNFIDSKFAETYVAERPLWASGLDSAEFGNDPTEEGIPFMAKKTVLQLQEQLTNGETTTEKIYESLRGQLTSYFGLPKGTGIFFAPSEATAQYIVLMIVQAMNPMIDSFHNIFTGIKRDELSQSVQTASHGEYFSEHVPFDKWKMDKALREGQVAGLQRWTTSQVLKTREDDTHKEGYLKKLKGIYELCELDDVDTLPILQSVGPLDQHMGEHWWQSKTAEAARVYNHIDGRLEKGRAQKHLQNGDIVIVNGSQYYQGPLQCAAVFIPPKMMESLKQIKGVTLLKQMLENAEYQTHEVNCFFGRNDFPKELENWRQCIEEGNENAGLALRWSAATASMDQLSHLQESQLAAIESQWNQQMTELIQQLPILSKQEYSADTEEQSHLSSITMTVGAPDKSGQGHLSRMGLSQLAYMMSEDMGDKLDWKAQQKVYANSGVKSLSDLSIDELKSIASRQFSLAAPVGLYALKHEEYGLKISMSYTDTLQHSLNIASDIQEHNMAENRGLLYKLAIMAYAMPQLSPLVADYKQTSRSIKKSMVKSQFAKIGEKVSKEKGGQDLTDKLSKMGFQN